jgi:hypothetical protein
MPFPRREGAAEINLDGGRVIVVGAIDITHEPDDPRYMMRSPDGAWSSLEGNERWRRSGLATPKLNALVCGGAHLNSEALVWQLAQINVGRLVAPRGGSPYRAILCGAGGDQRTCRRESGIHMAAAGRERQRHGNPDNAGSVVRREHVGLGRCRRFILIRLSKCAYARDGAPAAILREIRMSLSGALVDTR